MKEPLRKKLRAQRRSLSDFEHRQRSLAAAKAIMRLRMFSAGKRVALYLPFDRETDTAALIRAAQQRGVQIFVPVISSRRHCRLRFYPLKGETASARLEFRCRACAQGRFHRNGWTSSSYPWSASTAAVGGWGWGWIL